MTASSYTCDTHVTTALVNGIYSTYMIIYKQIVRLLDSSCLKTQLQGCVLSLFLCLQTSCLSQLPYDCKLEYYYRHNERPACSSLKKLKWINVKHSTCTILKTHCIHNICYHHIFSSANEICQGFLFQNGPNMHERKFCQRQDCVI